MSQVAEAKRCLAILGARWRASWADFDGRTLRAQLEEITAVLDAPDELTARVRAEAFVAEQREAMEQGF